MKTISRYIMTLALLLTAVTGAWAVGDTKYNVTFKANGHTKTVENVTLPKTFSCNVDDETGRGTDELDVIIQELYGLSGNYCFNTAPNSDNASVTCGVDDAELQYITVNAPFNGTATVTGKYIDTNFSVFDYSLEITLAEAPIEVTTNAASEQDLFTEALFKMPAFDATVNYMLVRDMQDETNPVAFTGLPTNDEPIVVKKGSDGKYQPAEALTIQLIDPLAAAEAQNIIAADGITIKVLVGDDSSLPIEYDHYSPITLDAFLADMKPGYYWIKAEQTDENSPYDGTVYSSQFTAVEKYDLTVKPANDFSKGKIESVTVGSGSVTIDANGKASKTGIDPDTEVKIKAKRGYIIDKVVVEKNDGSTSLDESTVGMIVCTNGKAYPVNMKDNLPSGVTAVGIVAYKNGKNGLVMALTDEATNMNWDTATGNNGAKAHTPAVEGYSWKVPTIGEWQYNIFTGAGVGNLAGLSTYMTAAGGTGLQNGCYWTSTPKNNSYYARCIQIENGSINFSPGGNTELKSNGYHVRAVFAF